MNRITYLMSVFTLLIYAGCDSKGEEEQPIKKVLEDWYSVSQIADDTWAFEEPKSSQYNVSYLIAGSKRAIMFDTGSGENAGQDGSKVNYKILETTQLPVTLLLSHFHFDHNQNVSEFNHIAFPEISFLKEKINENQKYTFSTDELFLGVVPGSVIVNEWLPLNTAVDLGDRKVEIMLLPGHTDESIAIIDHDHKLAFTGDFVYGGTLFSFATGDLEKYLASLESFLEAVGEDYEFYGAHGRPQYSYAFLLQVKELLNCIINSDCFEEISTQAFGYQATLYKGIENPATLLLIHTDL